MTRRAFAAFFLLVTLVASCGTLAGSPPPDRARQGDAASRATPCEGTGDDFPGDVKLARCLTEWFWANRFGTGPALDGVIGHDVAR
ncbi:hypothetical protein OG320_18575 [Microbispora sp. NBC_01189]|uniref:hypothetical protein n=1 Tax=Microbispora sp. NBC_01189 TaxID=2903583 RepID=UPI002E157A62|nr:hypothetical protein OG320_18575 [Microbispora sp. NBC_01189]